MNDAGERLYDFCESNGFVASNTLFEHHNRRKYTWKSPGDRYRNQIDYILVEKRWRNGILDCRTYPGADIDSDHILLVAKLRIRLTKLNKPRRAPRFQVDKLANEDVRAQFEFSLGNRFSFFSAVFTYACETWSMREEDRDSINAFEMWFYRRILRVSWVEHITNETILRRMGSKSSEHHKQKQAQILWRYDSGGQAAMLPI